MEHPAGGVIYVGVGVAVTVESASSAESDAQRQRLDDLRELILSVRADVERFRLELAAAETRLAELDNEAEALAFAVELGVDV